MWLRALWKGATAARHVYTTVFFVVLTWNVIRSQTKGGRKEWERDPRSRLSRG